MLICSWELLFIQGEATLYSVKWFRRRTCLLNDVIASISTSKKKVCNLARYQIHYLNGLTHAILYALVMIKAAPESVKRASYFHGSKAVHSLLGPLNKCNSVVTFLRKFLGSFVIIFTRPLFDKNTGKLTL